jgi:hypothetical protein
MATESKENENILSELTNNQNVSGTNINNHVTLTDKNQNEQMGVEEQGKQRKYRKRKRHARIRENPETHSNTSQTTTTVTEFSQISSQETVPNVSTTNKV